MEVRTVFLNPGIDPASQPQSRFRSALVGVGGGTPIRQWILTRAPALALTPTPAPTLIDGGLGALIWIFTSA